MKKLLKHVCTFFTATVVGCVTPSGGTTAPVPSSQKPVAAATKKPVNKKTAASTSMTIVQPGTIEGNTTATSDFIIRNLNPNTVMSADDQQYWTTLMSPAAPGSMNEAALVIGALKIAGALSASGSFKETDIEAKPQEGGEAAGATKSLYQICEERSISLIDALRTNPILSSNISVFTMVQQAIQRTNNPAALVTGINIHVQEQSELWRRLAGSGAESATVSESASPQEKTSPTAANSGLTATDLKNSDNILMEAQILADQKLYQAALAKVGQIGNDSPLYPEAQERVKSFSNGAVQELRQKAALAYQNSIPMSDRSAKENLLKQAKTHLEEAISSFPNSEQIGTVKENLQTIDRELDQLRY